MEHKDLYTAGTSYDENDIIDKSIDILKTNRGGKITYHGPGQLICYFVIDLKRRKKDIRKFVSIIENTIIETLKYYNIDSFSDKENIGIWINENNKIKKIAAIGVRVSKWIAYHGFSININNNLCNLLHRMQTPIRSISLRFCPPLYWSTFLQCLELPLTIISMFPNLLRYYLLD